MSVREVLGLAQEVNDVTVEPFPGPILSIRHERVEGDGSAFERVLHMNPLVAAAVCKRADELRPPGDGDGQA